MLDIRDVHVYGGIGLLALGLGFVYWPLAPIVVGAALLYLGLRRVADGRNPGPAGTETEG